MLVPDVNDWPYSKVSKLDWGCRTLRIEGNYQNVSRRHRRTEWNLGNDCVRSWSTACVCTQPAYNPWLTAAVVRLCTLIVRPAWSPHRPPTFWRSQIVDTKMRPFRDRRSFTLLAFHVVKEVSKYICTRRPKTKQTVTRRRSLSQTYVLLRVA